MNNKVILSNIKKDYYNKDMLSFWSRISLNNKSNHYQNNLIVYDNLMPSNIDEIRGKHSWKARNLILENGFLQYTFGLDGCVMKLVGSGDVGVCLNAKYLASDSLRRNKYYVTLLADSVYIAYNKVVWYIYYDKKRRQKMLSVVDYNFDPHLISISPILVSVDIVCVDRIEYFAKLIFNCTSQRINDIAHFMNIPDNHFVMSGNGCVFLIPLSNNKFLKVRWKKTVVIKLLKRSIMDDDCFWLYLSNLSRDFFVHIEYRKSSNLASKNYIDIEFFKNLSSFVKISQVSNNHDHQYTVNFIQNGRSGVLSDVNEIIISSDRTSFLKNLWININDNYSRNKFLLFFYCIVMFLLYFV